MRPLRYSWLWLGIGGILVVLVIAGSLGPAMSVIGARSDKLMHLVAYLVLAVWFGGVYRPARYPLLAAGLLVLGAVMEVAQGMLPYRSMELADALANAAGVLAGIVLCWTMLGSWCQWVEARLLSRP